MPWSKVMVKDVRQLRLNLDTIETSCLELDDWGQLAISSPQLGGVFRSGPVWPGLSGYRTVLMVPVGRRVQVRSWLNQAMRQRPGGVGFRVGTAKGAVGAVMERAVLGEKVQGDKWHLLGQSFVTDRPEHLPDGYQTEREGEVEGEGLAPGEWTPKVSGVVRKPLDIAGDLMALIQGLGRFRNIALGLSREVHHQDPYDRGIDLDRGKGKEL
ncbi:hypothetical protein F2Q68_00033563 [Brassica cretica]|uniref:Uncharacterized protein n=1 Tax=Brassica cretica TaxID=69181 RepID=A0A8S9H9F7_BRACR|nr:hypothetical protein F2Q68_00033563 [Brassica cretica]